MPDIIQASSGQQSVTEDVSGPSSYPSGGFSHRTDLGRVDRATAAADAGSVDSSVNTIQNNNEVVISVFSQGGGEVASGTDLSHDTYTVTANRL